MTVYLFSCFSNGTFVAVCHRATEEVPAFPLVCMSYALAVAVASRNNASHVSAVLFGVFPHMVCSMCPSHWLQQKKQTNYHTTKPDPVLRGRALISFGTLLYHITQTLWHRELIQSSASCVMQKAEACCCGTKPSWFAYSLQRRCSYLY